MANAQQIALQMARRYFQRPQDQQTFMRQMQAENNFGDATSPAGALGPAQLMPGTAAEWGVANPHDPAQAFRAAASHMADYLRQYGSWRDALTAYNAGPGAVGKPLPTETQNYVAKILGGHNVASGGAGAAPAAQTLLQSIQTPTFDQQAFQTAQKRYALGQLLAGQGQQKDNPLFATGLVTTQAPNPQDFAGTKTTTQAVPASGSPAPSGKGSVVDFGGKQVAGWIAPILNYARQHGWQGQVQSGYRSYAEQKAIYDSGVRPAAAPGTSNHESTAFPGGAVDVTNAPQLAQILARSPYAQKLVWAGAKDPVHFSFPHGGSY